uniref:Uncharacterized protein n=1 Tax=Anguilla anguilla TaxID=7936 RepID=A0A0E9R1E8_ANGAN
MCLSYEKLSVGGHSQFYLKKQQTGKQNMFSEILSLEGAEHGKCSGS